MKIRNLFLILSILSILTSCVKWDLDKRELWTFQTQITAVEMGHKTDIIQLVDNSYALVGASISDSILFAKINEEGIVTDEKEIFGKGVGHRIIEENDSLLILASSANNTYLMATDKMGNIGRVDSFKTTINTEIGLLENVNGIDCIKIQDNNFLMLGSLQQTIGNPRLFLLKFDQLNDVIWLRIFGENYQGTHLKELTTGEILMQGRVDNKTFIIKTDEEGIFSWFKLLNEPYQIPTNQLSNHDTTLFFSTLLEGNINILSYAVDGTPLSPIDTFENLSYSQSPILINEASNIIISSFTNEQQIYLAELTINGDIIWASLNDTDFESIPTKIIQTNDKGYLIFGQSSSPFTDAFYFLLKTDAEGKTRL